VCAPPKPDYNRVNTTPHTRLTGNRRFPASGSGEVCRKQIAGG
jgi:hypothetical protein